MQGVFPVGILGGLLLLSLAILLAGVFIRRKGGLQSSGAWIIWVLISAIPLFGGGAALFIKHQTNIATGETQSGTLHVEGPQSTTQPQPEVGNGI